MGPNMTLRRGLPARSTGNADAPYRKFKPNLREDFSQRCGYCDGDDHYCGGSRGFQIDHFAPYSVFPELENVYANLVYCCPYCNRAKWNKWIGTKSDEPVKNDEGFIDPCDAAYDEHLARNEDGHIVGLTALGNYMRLHLKLSLLRHQLIWQAEKLDELKQKILQKLPEIEAAGDHARHVELLKQYIEVDTAYKEYRKSVIG